MASGALFSRRSAYPILDGMRERGATLAEVRGALYEALTKRFGEVEARALAVKTVNLVQSRRHFEARDVEVQSQPYGLVVDPSNVCQLACPGCVHGAGPEAANLFDWPKGTLPEARFAGLLRRYGATAVAVYFCDYGEPLLNIQTPKLIRMAKTFLLATALSTSLSVRRFDAEAYVESGLDYMVVSIDGATQDVYERFRRNGNLELVMENLRRLVEAKRRMGKRTPLLSWNFLAFEHNSHQIEDAERLARKAGVNYFRVVKPFDVGWDDPEIRVAETVDGYVRRLDWTSTSNPPENWNPFPETLAASAFDAAYQTAIEERVPALPGSSQGHTCHWLYKNLVMDATGRVLPCCGAPGKDDALIFGRMDGTASEDPFRSEKYRSARTLFATGGEPRSAAIACSQCSWDQTKVSIGPDEIRRYFRSADPVFFDRRSLGLLASW